MNYIVGMAITKSLSDARVLRFFQWHVGPVAHFKASPFVMRVYSFSSVGTIRLASIADAIQKKLGETFCVGISCSALNWYTFTISPKNAKVDYSIVEKVLEYVEFSTDIPEFVPIDNETSVFYETRYETRCLASDMLSNQIDKLCIEKVGRSFIVNDG